MLFLIVSLVFVLAYLLLRVPSLSFTWSVYIVFVVDKNFVVFGHLIPSAYNIRVALVVVVDCLLPPSSGVVPCACRLS